MAKGRTWSRDELIVVFNLYCTMSFGQMHSRNPHIIEMAQVLGRTPGSVAMKLVNFASFDPAHQSRGVRGLSGASHADRAIWNEFHANWEPLAFESEQRLSELLAIGTERAKPTNFAPSHRIQSPGLRARWPDRADENCTSPNSARILIGKPFSRLTRGLAA